MPATVPSHQAAVLPLKLAWPRRFDGIALVTGSVAPDLSYAFHPWWSLGSTHDVAALAWWSIPIAVVAALAIRRLVLPHAALRMPMLGPLRVRDFAASSTARYGFAVTVASAAIGAATHVGWDVFTHESVSDLLPSLVSASPFGPPWYKILQYGGGAVGLVVSGLCLVRVGRTRLVTRLHGPIPDVASPAVPWWTTFGVVAVPLTAGALAADGATGPHILVSRGLWTILVASAVAGVVARAAVGDAVGGRVTVDGR